MEAVPSSCKTRMRCALSCSSLVSKGKSLLLLRSSLSRQHVRNLCTISPDLEKELLLYSKKKQTPVSLKSLMESGRGDNPNLPSGKSTKASDKVIMQVACFLHREMPVRLAHRAVKLEASPLFQMSGKIVTIYSIICLLLSIFRYNIYVNK